MLPHFSGAGTPVVDPTSRAAILGMSFATTQADIAKAILEGLTFELRTNIDVLNDAGIRIDQLHAVGGGAKSGLWLQLKADIGRVPLRVPRVTEAACLGAAMLAAVGAGEFANLSSAVEAGVVFNSTLTPNPDSTKAYEKRYEFYRSMYDRLIHIQRNAQRNSR